MERQRILLTLPFSRYVIYIVSIYPDTYYIWYAENGAKNL